MIDDKEYEIFFKKMNSLRDSIDDEYSNNIVFLLNHKIPMIFEKSKTNFIFMSPEIVKENLSEHYIFSELIKKYSIEVKEYNDNDEIYDLLNFFYNILKEKLDDLIEQSMHVYLFSLQQMLDYNIHMTLNLSELFSGKDIEYKKIEEQVSRDICYTFWYHKQYFKSKGKQINEATLYLNNLLARDKQAIQKSISYILSKKQLVDADEISDSNSFDFVELLNTSRAIILVLELLDIFKTNKKTKIRVTDDYLYLKNSDSRVKDNCLEEQIKKVSIGHNITDYETFQAEISPVCQKYLGLEISEIDILISRLREKMNIFSYVTGTSDDISKLISDISKLELRNVKLLINQLLHSQEYMNNSGFSNYQRYLRKPLIPYGNNYYCVQIYILIFTLIGLIEDIKYGLVENPKFKKDLENHVQSMQNIFEYNVAKIIENELPKSKIICDVPQNAIEGIHLYGQIDVLVLYNRNVIVIECKALPMKYDMKSQVNASGKINREFQNKINKKVLNLRERKSYVEKFFEGEKINKIRGVIVLKYPISSTESTDNLKFPVIHVSELIEYIKENS
ncbi:nuclease-related domain-containing protein [Isobaculum melis]|uniref:Nuclease-related domain-containing protein n=1 Tax=Isobaculum melis TaxID=142588 RepID=A0A1H9U4A0_9LACT|nr:nuclease-related domain-containing protein [Isobaculum melis]SES04071.1 Nuclease-related domain-containing protein [Isobaculum melis]